MIFAADKQEQRLKWAFESCKNGAWGNEPDGDGDVVCIRAADFDGQSGRMNNGERTLRSIEPNVFHKIALRPGDLVMEKSGGGEKQLVGRTVLFDDERPSVCSNFLARCRPAEGVEPAYLNYLMLAIYAGRGTYPHIKQSTGIQNLDLGGYLDTRVSIPALAVQQRIARFLDEKIARIDALIGKKQALLERLAEQRHALVTRTVTKGLNPDVPMKPSGIGWVGDIPQTWSVKPLKRLAKIGNGSTPSREDPGYWDQGHYPWMNSSVVNGNVAANSSDLVTDLALKECHLPKIQPPAVLVGITGQGKTRGMATLLVVEATINQHIAYLKPHEGIADAAYLHYILSSAYEHLRMESDGGGSTKGAITCEQLGNLKIPVPACRDQTSISGWVDAHVAGMDRQTDLVSRSIEAQHAYRSALITAAVTGQLPELNG